MPLLDQVKKGKISRTIVVADKGINTADNIAFCLAKGDGCLFPKCSWRNKELKSMWILRATGNLTMVTNQIQALPREIAISNDQGGERIAL